MIPPRNDDTLDTPQTAFADDTLEAILEAILFAAGDPISLERLSEAVGVALEAVEATLLTLSDRLAFTRTGVRLSRIGDRFQLHTAPEYAEFVRRVTETRKPTLSASSLEALAIVAYREPVTRAFIEKVRGVDSSYTVAALVDRGLIEDCGRLDVPGRPILYRTTPAALRVFGVESVADLPPLPEEMELPAPETSEELTGEAVPSEEGLP